MNDLPPTGSDSATDEVLSRAWLAAALAFKGAAETATPAALLGIAAETAASSGASPAQAASIAIELQKFIGKAADPVAAVTSQLAPGAVAGEAVSTELAAAAEVATAAATVERNALARQLLKVNEHERRWVSLPSLAGELSQSVDAVAAALGELGKDEFVKLENLHVWLNESGKRYLEYCLQTS